MLFIGSGTLLHHAIHYAQSVGIDVRGVCCPPGELMQKTLKKSGIKVVESDRPGASLVKMIGTSKNETVFSINNRHLLSDEVLASHASFFNVHNGLIQKYRGISEACVFAALCRDEEEYGVTLHRVLPGQRVDSGPVVEQMVFDVLADDGFSDVMDHSLKLCRQVFERNVLRIAQGALQSYPVEVARKATNYAQLAELYAVADPDARRRAAQLGEYRPYFPRLHSLAMEAPGTASTPRRKSVYQRKGAL